MSGFDGYPPISDYGIIGDGYTVALISSQGSIDWLCLPRFDSPSIFCRILDTERGGAWSVQPCGQFQAQHRYVEHTNVLETIFTVAGGQVRLLDFMPLTGDGPIGTSRPDRLVIRLVEGMEGEVQVESVCSPRPNYASTLAGLEAKGEQVTFGNCTLSGPVAWLVDESQGIVSCRTLLREGDRLAFVLCYDGESGGGSAADPYRALGETLNFWRGWAGLCTYEGPYREAVVRSALTLRLLTYTPTGAIVAAPTTSLPEEIGGERNWDYRFAWIRDASFTLYAFLLAGYVEEDDAFFRWIVETVRLEQTGIRILYPISPEGGVEERVLDHLEGYRGSRPVRIGNGAAGQVQLDVYGEVMDALFFAWKAGGYDPTPVWSYFRPLVDWVAQNWDQPGSGIWEVRGGLRHFVYGKVLMWVALDRGIKIAQGLGLPGDVGRWRAQRDTIRAQVLEKGWSDRLGAFKQSYEDELLDASSLMLSMVGFIDGDDPRMLSTIDATLEHLVVDGLCYRYLDAPEGLSGGEATFVLCTFWLVDALILAGRQREAEALFEGVLNRATPLGLFAEEIDPGTGEHLGNFPQAFSHLGLISAAVSLAQAGKTGKVRSEHAEAASRPGMGGGGQRSRTHSAQEI